MSKFKTGDEVYNEYGNVARYVMPSSSYGHIVEPYYENGEDEDPTTGGPECWNHVFAKPAPAKLNQEMAEIQAAIEQKRQELRSIQNDIYEAERDRAEALRRIQGRPDLTDLDLWLQGKVTHIVSLGYYSIEIGTVEETLLRQEDRGREMRLLSLKVDPRANYFWVSYASYSDGSGSQTRCLLATSMEHAKDLTAKYVADEIRKAPTNDHSSLVLRAHKLGVTVPSDRLEIAQQKDKKLREERIARARKELERKQKELAELEALS